MIVRIPVRKGNGGVLLACGVLALVQGCAQPASGPQPRLYAIDHTGGAKACSASKPELGDGKEAAATMSVSSEGGWCGMTVAQSGPKPFDAGLLVARPAHGKVYVHTVGNETRIDYTPDTGFSGQDAFTVRLVPGNAVLRVSVTATGRA